MLAGGLFVAALLAVQAASHLECTEYTYEGTVREADRVCVGDYVLVPGPDLLNLFLLAVGGAVAIYFSFRRLNRGEEERE